MKETLLASSSLPFGAPAFDRIEKSDYLPAFREAIDRGRAEIQAITDNPQPPTFTNTVEALERAGRDLDRISDIFFNLTEAVDLSCRHVKGNGAICYFYEFFFHVAYLTEHSFPIL